MRRGAGLLFGLALGACAPERTPPTPARVTLCWSDAAGQCSKGTTDESKRGEPVVGCLPALGASAFRVGDTRFVTAQVNPLSEAYESYLKLSAAGVIEFVHPDPTQVEFSNSLRGHSWRRTVEVKARSLGAGLVAIEYPFVNGAAELRVHVTERSITGVASAQVVRLDGAQTQVRLGICSTLPPSSELKLLALRGAVARDGQVLLSRVPGDACPEGYRGYGTTTWTGDQELEELTFEAADGVTHCDLEMPGVVRGLEDLEVDGLQWTTFLEGGAAGVVHLTALARTSTGVLPISDAPVSVTPLDPAVSVEPVEDTDAAGGTTLFLRAPEDTRSVVLSLAIDKLRTSVVIDGPMTGSPGDGSAGAPAE